MRTLYIKNKNKIEINCYPFKVTTTKISQKFTMFQKSFYMFKTLKKNMWTCGFLVSKVLFPRKIMLYVIFGLKFDI
jgi:hypothetical protein